VAGGLVMKTSRYRGQAMPPGNDPIQARHSAVAVVRVARALVERPSRASVLREGGGVPMPMNVSFRRASPASFHCAFEPRFCVLLVDW
jgi:hypothetical protein